MGELEQWGSKKIGVEIRVWEEWVLSDIIDSICLAHIILMKSFKQEMENQADQDDFDPEDILKAFRQLQQPHPQLPL